MASLSGQWLAGKAVVMTGAGGSIGSACALAAAAEGAKVVVNDINLEAANGVVEKIRAAGGTAIANNDNVASWAGSKALIGHCVAEFGFLDGLFNNAALIHNGFAIEESEVDIRAQVEVNVLGVLYCGRHAMEQMAKQGRGAIVNMSSSAVWGVEGMATYGATKGAVASATYSWAFELQKYGISVNAVAPLAVSEMVTKATPEAMERLGYREKLKDPAQYRKVAGVAQGTPPANNAPLIVYLLGQPPGISGQFLQMRGSRLAVIHRSANHLKPHGVMVERDAWTLDAIREVFESTLNSQLQPVANYVRP